MKETLLYRIREGVKDVFYIWAKEMRQTFTDEGVLIFFFIVPIFYPLLYSWAYSNEVVREVPVAIVDLSHSHQSRQFIRQFDASPNTKAAYYCNSIEEARELVGKQVVHGVLYFPPDFQTLTNRMEQTHVSVYCDMSLMLTYKAIFQTAQEVASDMNTKLQIAMSGNYTDREDEISTHPLAFDEVPVFNPTGGYGSFLIPAVLILIIQQTLLLGIGFGKSLAYFMIFCVIAAYLTIIVPRLFGFTTLLSAGSLIGLLLPFILASIFFGMMLSCVVRYRENVILLVIFSSLPFLFISGVSWPQSSVPGVWRGISILIPSTFGIRGFIRLNTMGATLSDIRLEYQALWIQTFVYFIATCLVYRFQIMSAHRHANERIQSMKEKATKAKQKKLENDSEN